MTWLDTAVCRVEDNVGSETEVRDGHPDSQTIILTCWSWLEGKVCVRSALPVLWRRTLLADRNCFQFTLLPTHQSADSPTCRQVIACQVTAGTDDYWLGRTGASVRNCWNVSDFYYFSLQCRDKSGSSVKTAIGVESPARFVRNSGNKFFSYLARRWNVLN